MLELSANIKFDAKKILAEVDKKCKIIVNDSAVNIHREAVSNYKANGTNNTGSISRIQIDYKQANKGTVFVGAYFGHAAFIEFGTRTLIKIPSELSEYASQFNGKGGFVSYKALIDWVRKRGIAGTTKSGKTSKSKNAEQARKTAAYFIAKKLNTVGMRPQPFLYPAFFKERHKFLANVNKLFK